jgi:hypothetical protein
MNFVSVFRKQIFGVGCPVGDFAGSMRIIADRCERTTVAMLTNTGIPLILTDAGNAGSFRAALEMATECEDDELIYFCEDDYLHQHGVEKILEEGIKRADYVSLYDHPDKYTRFYNGGEYSKVIRTESSHWRFTASTCMTFAAKAKTLKQDKEVWLNHTSESHPWDHKIFTDLAKLGRKLAVPLPGWACHTDLTFSGTIGKTLMEPWAIEMMCGILNEKILHEGFLRLKDKYNDLDAYWIGKLKSGWEKLVAYDALLTDIMKRSA